METERLLLKLYEEKDKEHFINLSTDKAVMKYVDLGVLTVEQAESLWRKLVEKMYPQGVSTIWAIFAKTDSRYIGHAAIRPRPEKPDDWEISYMLRQEEWGKGFATEIVRRLIKFGFEELNLAEVFATVDANNFASMRVLEKAKVSFLRCEFDDGGRFSVYSIKLSNQS